MLIIVVFWSEINSYPKNPVSIQAKITDDHQTDWSVEMANTILAIRTTDMRWDYTVGLLLEGMLRVYKRTGDQRYLNFISEWANKRITENGSIFSEGKIMTEVNSLDNIMPGFLILHLYRETGIEKYKLAADKLKDRLKNTYPRTPERLYWHTTELGGELWLDGLYMGFPFLVTYGRNIGDEYYTYAEAIHQFKLHINYLTDNETGLLVHAFDYDGSATWALPPAKRSPHVWSRAVGWVVMGLSEILDIIPEGFPQREDIVKQYQDLLKSLAEYQDPKTGLWYQVVDHPDDPDNWLETSGSMMFVYAMARAIQKGFLDESYKDNVTLGYNGVLTKISKNEKNLVELKDICDGTGVSSSIQYYFDRAKKINDNHGLGTFMIMNEMVRYDNLPWIVSGPTSDHGIKSREIKVYPNPVTNILTIEYEDDDVIYFKIISAVGSVISTEKAVVPLQHIDFSGYGQGLYILEFMKADGNTLRRKILKH